VLSAACVLLRASHAEFERTRLYDVIMRVPVIGYSSLALVHDIYGFCAQIVMQPAIVSAPDLGVVVATTARVSQWIFTALLAVLPIFRLRPIAKSKKLSPRFGAFVAACLPATFLLLDRAPASVAFNSASVLLGLAANMMCIVTVSFLGRSLSIMPEARRLVTAGPYSQVRHPLYLCEVLGLFAFALQYRSLAVAGLLVVIVGLQAGRARWEEQVLARTFKEYAIYRGRTSFLLPHDPARFFAMFLTDPAARVRACSVAAATLILVFALLALPELMA